MTDTPLLIEHHQHILKLTLNRPDTLNAMTLPMIEALRDTLHQAQTDDSVRVVLITGEGRGFCSGQDLSVARDQGATTGEMDYGNHLRETLNPLIFGIAQLPKPVIGAINGVAAGAGMSLALACDLKIMAESAVFASAFIKIALIPDAGSTWFLPRLVGLARAMEICFSGRKVNAAESLAIGMVNQVVPDTDLTPTATALAEQLAQAPTRTIGYMKQAFAFGFQHSLEATLDNEAALQTLAGKSADHIEGLNAFLEKRTPRFIGQ